MFDPHSDIAKRDPRVRNRINELYRDFHEIKVQQRNAQSFWDQAFLKFMEKLDIDIELMVDNTLVSTIDSYKAKMAGMCDFAEAFADIALEAREIVREGLEEEDRAAINDIFAEIKDLKSRDQEI